MRKNKKHHDCWIDVYEHQTFGGKLQRLFLGQKVSASQVGSFIVGPSASAKCVDGENRIVATIPPMKVIECISSLLPKKHASVICVVKATPIRSHSDMAHA